MSALPNRVSRGRVAVVGLAGLLLGAVCASCGSLSQPAPDRALFALDPGEPAGDLPQAARATSHLGSPAADTLMVVPVRVAAPYDGSGFVYRVAGDQFQSDYYNGWIAPAGVMLSNVMSSWMAKAGLFRSVVDSGSGFEGQYVLEGSVVALLGDYSDKAAPKAVVKMRMLLGARVGGGGRRIVFQREYDAAEPITSAGARGLVSAWDRALRSDLVRLSGDVRKQLE